MVTVRVKRGVYKEQPVKRKYKFLVGDKFSIADLALWNALRFIKYFAQHASKDMALALNELFDDPDALSELKKYYRSIAMRPKIAAYLESDRCYRIEQDKYMLPSVDYQSSPAEMNSDSDREDMLYVDAEEHLLTCNIDITSYKIN